MATPAGSDNPQWRLIARGGPACDVCRRRKTRCQPNTSVEGGPCEFCKTAGVSCSFAPRLQGPPTTYVESLELRLEATQELLRNLSTSAGVDLVSLAERSTEPGASAEIKKAVQSLQNLSKDPEATQSSSLSARPFSPPDKRIVGIFEGRFAGKSAEPTLAAQIMDDYAPRDLQFNVIGDPTCLVEDLLAAEESTRSSLYFALPPTELVQLLVCSYFTNINDHMPLLHRPSFSRLLNSGEAETSAPYRSLLFVVLALGTRFVTDSRLRGDWSAPALFRASCCQHQLGLYKQSVSTLHELQALPLALIYLLGAKSSLDAWEAGGAGLRAFVDVGAHLESTERWKSNPLTDQLRKRSFFCLYVLDLYVSSTLGRPVALQEDDFNLAYPVSMDDSSLDCWASMAQGQPQPPSSPSLVDLFRCFASLAAIHSKTLSLLYSPGSEQLTAGEVHVIVEEQKRRVQAMQLDVPQHLTWEFNGPGHESTLLSRGHLACAVAATQIAIIRPFVLILARTRDSTLSLIESAFTYGGQANRLWNAVLGVFLQKGMIPQCFYWLPISAGYPSLVSFHILRTPLVSGRYLLSVLEGLHRTMRALQTLKDTTPEASIVWEGCRRLTLRVNEWRAQDNFDFNMFLVSPTPAPIDLYLTLPPFCISVEANLERLSSASPSPPTLDDIISHKHSRGIEAWGHPESSAPVSGESTQFYPFQPQSWESQIAQTFPRLPSDLVLNALPTFLGDTRDWDRMYAEGQQDTFKAVFPTFS